SVIPRLASTLVTRSVRPNIRSKRRPSANSASARAHFRRDGARTLVLQEALQPAPPFAQMAVALPERPQRAGQPQADLQPRQGDRETGRQGEVLLKRIFLLVC